MDNRRAEAVLSCPMLTNDAGAETVRDYFRALLGAVWRDGEGFNGKRPFGNSGWEYEVIESLVAAGLADDVDADALVADAIRHL